VGFTETLTRPPAGAPIAASQDAPIRQAIDAPLPSVFLAGRVAQRVWLRASLRAR